jgi:hypothetical protein
MPDIHQRYESAKDRQIVDLNKRIRDIYAKAIQQIQITISTVTYKGTKFNLKDYPGLRNKINAELKKMQASIYAGVVNGIDASWDLSNKKNDLLVDQRFKGRKLNSKVRQILYDPNVKALQAFKARTDRGLDLSNRVWKVLKPFTKSLEQTIGLGLGQGTPARDIAKNIKQYLNEPDKLFRKVQGEDGKLHLSKAARDYHPGQGVYRSSFKNAMRVARSEVNMAFRTSDHIRWQSQPFTIGFEVKLSNTHPDIDECDQLKGVYPKKFLFVGWHPQCKCYKVPKLVSEKEFQKMEDAILDGKPVESAQQIADVPKNFKEFVQDNRKRIAGWKNKPYWLRDNVEFVPK